VLIIIILYDFNIFYFIIVFFMKISFEKNVKNLSKRFLIVDKSDAMSLFLMVVSQITIITVVL